MTGVKIPVQADFDQKSLESQLEAFRQKMNAFGQQIARANKVQYSPVSKVAVEDLRKVTQQFEALKRVSGGLNNRINTTGQKGSGFFDLDWAKMYPNQAARQRKMAEAFQHVTGMDMHTPVAPGGRKPRPGTTAGGVGVGVVQAGLRGANGATGGASGVAANALGTGMAAGAGAGLMGLFGGLLALGVGKVIGSIADKIDQAEKNNVAYDTLKRTLGDVNVSFNGLKATVQSAADNVSITFEEAGKLGQQFAKLGNLTADRYSSLHSEITTGVGFSRGFGLDPSQGVGFMGTMRGLRQTQDENGTRRMALLIGETIAKSDAFAKADEVMDAIAGYATSQTRNSLGQLNLEGYAGSLSALTRSGIPGLDPAGSAALLSRVNSSLMAGGAKGEASQFFTSQVGRSMGLDPLQTQVLREGGAFATNDEAFGSGSVASRYGMGGPGGNKTFLQASLEQLRGKYKDKGMLANATANHLGVGMRQAMALLSVDPDQMGGMQKYADLSTMNAGGIANLGKVLYGSGAEREEIRGSLLGRADVSKEDKAQLEGVQWSKKTAEQQKETLAKITAQYDQERTTGSDIRDSKNALDNIKVSLADKVVPLLTHMRLGILYLAGDRNKTPNEALREIIDLESEDRRRAIGGEFDPKILAAEKQMGKLRSEIVATSNMFVPASDDGTIAKERAAKLKELRDDFDRVNLEHKGLRRQKQERLDQEESRAESSKIDPSGSAAGRDVGSEALFNAMISQESGWRHRDKEGNLLKSPTGALGISQVLPSTAKDPGYGVSPLQNDTEEEYLRFGRDYLNAMLKEFGGDKRKALAAYNQGAGAVKDAIKAAGAKGSDDWLSEMNSEARNYVPSIMNKAEKGTPVPGGPQASLNQEFRVKADPIEVVHLNDRGQQVAPSQTLQTRVVSAQPFGTQAYS